jgi:gamma-glutamyltranspeptidase/glutathione hydrolase
LDFIILRKTKAITKLMRIYLTILLSICLLACADKKPQTQSEGTAALQSEIQKTAKAIDGMVVSAHPLATKVGLKILKQGGNAYDAMVASQFALGVVYPRAGNIGGGGFFIARLNDGASLSLDFREKAPSKASKDMYLDEEGNVIPKASSYGHLAVGVPGTVAGLFEIYDRLGSFEKFEDLIRPAYELASNGFAISATEADRLNQYRPDFLEQNTTSNQFIETELWNEGDTLVQEDLARSLARIMKAGTKGFYEGKTAELIVEEMQRANGLISLEDLKNYNPIWRTPLKGSFKEYNIISMPPSSSGGIALIQMLSMLENLKPEEHKFQSPLAINALTETMRIAYEDRANYLGDADFHPVPVDSLLNKTYLDKRLSAFSYGNAGRSNPNAHSGIRLEIESFETTHTSIVDSEGHAASLTTTLNSNYGSKILVGRGGFFLNNEMDDFSAKPGVANQYGLVGSEANAIAPNKRMLSSMTPTIIEKEDELYMVLGTPGGSTIITSVLQVFLNTAIYNMDLNDAVQSGRIHHQWLPDMIMYEKGKMDSISLKELNDMGYKLVEKNTIAKVKAIQVLEDGTYYGVGDERNPDDHAEGINFN